MCDNEEHSIRNIQKGEILSLHRLYMYNGYLQNGSMTSHDNGVGTNLENYVCIIVGTSLKFDQIPVA